MKKVPLTKGFFALVDDADYERVMRYTWCASIESRGTKVYAVRWATKAERVAMGLSHKRNVKIRLHRWLLGLGPDPEMKGPVVDHDNEDGLDCTRGNLVVRSQSENMKKVRSWKQRGKAHVRQGEEVEPWL